MEIYLYANLSGTSSAPDAVIAFDSREAVNAYLNAAYEIAVLSLMDKRGGRLPKGVETQDEFRTRVWHSCVTKSELWTTHQVAQDRKKALDEREERRRFKAAPIPISESDDMEF